MANDPGAERKSKLDSDLSKRFSARLLVDGLDHDATILGEEVPAFWPLTLVQAASTCGYPLKKARNYLGDHPPFNALRRRIMDGRRKAEEARNLATAIRIRDDEGDGSAADRTVRLKAIGVIEGNEGDNAGVVVNVNPDVEQRMITPTAMSSGCWGTGPKPTRLIEGNVSS